MENLIPKNENESTPTSDFKITRSIIDKWFSQLMNHKSSNTLLIYDNKLIENHKYGNSLDIDPITLQKDISRTRVTEKRNIPKFDEDISNILIFYCEYNTIKYKQGMNEILGVLYLLNTLEGIHLELYEIFNLFSLLIDAFFTNYFSDYTLDALKSSVEVVRLLLKYHEPFLFSLFEASFLETQMYSANWLFTGYSGKNSLEVTYKLFNELIMEMDKAKMYFIIIAFLVKNKESFMKATNITLIMGIFSKCKVETIQEMEEILNISKQIKSVTPYSIYLLINNLEIFVPKTKNLKKKFEKIQPDSFLAIPIYPIESLFYMYPEMISCPDFACKNYKINCNENLTWAKGNKLCTFCFDNQIKRNLNYNYCNLMQLKSLKKQLCKLTRITKLKNSFFTKPSIQQKVVRLCKELNENSHKVLLPTSTLNHNTFENKFYSLELEESEELCRKCGLLWNDKEKVIQVDEVSNFIGDNINKEFQINEYEVLRKTIQALLEQEIKYVSFAYGGYIELHRLATTIGLILDNKKEKNCPFCKKFKELPNQSSLQIVGKDLYNQYLTKKRITLIFQCLLKKKQTEMFLNNVGIRLFTTITMKEGKYVFRTINYDCIIAVEKQGNNLVNILYTQNLTFSKLKDIKIEFINDSEIEQFFKLLKINT